jgi:glucose/arabinose dehydrogenase/cytochrome c553
MKLLKLLFFLVFIVLFSYSYRVHVYDFLRKSIYKVSSKEKLEGVYFNSINLGEKVKGIFTTLTIGPDEKLYAASISGEIQRFQINKDGKLRLEHTFLPFDSPRLLIGFRFDPKASKDNLKIWITYCQTFDLEHAPNWDGRLARLQLSPNSDKVLENTLVINNLPRSAKDHLTNGIDFDKDGFLYFNQGSNTMMGRACREAGRWDERREEELLSATVLKLDISKLPNDLPLDVKTSYGGNYNPYHPSAPLTIYATGIRNAYDLVWHSNGELYVPVNGSAKGGSTPTSDPQHPYYIKPVIFSSNQQHNSHIPPLADVRIPQEDWLLKVKYKGYYGHPNPLRGEFVLNRGEKDVKVKEYEGIIPAENFQYPAYSMGVHAAPTGIIEYKNGVFNNKLNGMLMVARYNLYDDILIMQIDPLSKNITHSYDGKDIGLGQIDRPLDIIEDQRNGNLYISQYGNGGKILLFKPIENGEKRIVNPPNNDKLDEKSLKFNMTDGELRAGEHIFKENCIACHGEEAQGILAPNLADEYWIHGGSTTDIFKTIYYGTDKGMQAWQNKLSVQQIQQLTSYILSLQGSNPKNPLPPEGKKIDKMVN